MSLTFSDSPNEIVLLNYVHVYVQTYESQVHKNKLKLIDATKTIQPLWTLF